jgi:hypothetical protein
MRLSLGKSTPAIRAMCLYTSKNIKAFLKSLYIDILMVHVKHAAAPQNENIQA